MKYAAFIAVLLIILGCNAPISPYSGQWLASQKQGISLPEALYFADNGTGFYHYTDSITGTDIAEPIRWEQCAEGLWVHGSNGSWVYNATFAHDTLCLKYVESYARYIRK